MCLQFQHIQRLYSSKNTFKNYSDNIINIKAHDFYFNSIYHFTLLIYVIT